MVKAIKRSSDSAWKVSFGALVLLVSAGLGGCGDAERCAPTAPQACTPRYTPVFEEVFAQTLQPSCGLAGSACHSTAGAQGGLILDDPDAAFAGLQSRLTAGDGQCGELLFRLYSDDAGQVMPPGRPLSEEERCAVRLWVEMGATR